MLTITAGVPVLEIYRITLLSNLAILLANLSYVLEIYRITLLSNAVLTINAGVPVLEIYRITLLSNIKYLD